MPGLSEDAIAAIKTAEALGIRMARADVPDTVRPSFGSYSKDIDYCRTLAGHRDVEEFHIRLIPLLPVRLDIDLRNATVSAGGLRKSQRSPCLIRAFQQWEGTQHHALPEPRG